jgi:hypothetical protein
MGAADGATTWAVGVLDPMDRIAEVLFGLIMVLTFTGSISAAESGREEVRTLLVGAIGCNLAWGVIDAVMYLMARLGEHGLAWRTYRAFRDAAGPEEARSAVASALPPVVAAAIGPAELESIRAALERMPPVTARPRLGREDWMGALGVFVLVVLSTFPVVLPFLFVPEAIRALRVSNAVAIAMLFGLGYAFGRVAHHRPWLMALAMVGIGLVLVAVTIALGG